MAGKVFLSPSNQPRNMCRLGHSEKDHADNLADLMLPLLDAVGIEYRLRKSGSSLSGAVNDATGWGADIYIPMHTNAANGTARGTRFGFYPGRGDSNAACEIFKKNWQSLYPLPDKVKTTNYTFYEAKNPKCPSVYCELIFHDNINDATWFHENMELVAQNLVKSIANFFGISTGGGGNPTPSLPNDGSVVNLKITRQENADYHKVNIGDIVHIPLEEYLLGVVPAEVGNPPIEAAKAQAIAARTYAFVRTKGGKIIDDTAAYQAYRASRIGDKAYANAYMGVNETRGQMLYYNGSIAATTVYSQSNGGMSVSAKDRWGGSVPYLITQVDPWTSTPAKGHGVGMSQDGAISAANKGVKYDKILAFYYPGTELLPKKVSPVPPPVQPPKDPVEPVPEPVPTEPITPKADVLYIAEVVTRQPVSLNIWRDANKGVSIKRVPRGAVVEVLQEVNEVWAKVRYAGVVGYCDRQYLKHGELAHDTLYNAVVKTLYPLSLNIWRDARKGISLGKIPNGAVAEVLAEVDETWAKVRYKDIIGYSDRQYLQKL